MPTRRQRRIQELIHRELSTLLLMEVRDPRISGVNILDVEVTRDLLLARVYYSAMDDADTKEMQAGMESATGYLRTKLASRAELRFVPELVFRLDQSAAYAQRIDDLLERIRDDERSAGQPEST